ncbi:MAG: autoinducer binding domain-containing protein [Maritimibacter sp.]|nr:autoinducer binding domain-containing protein [Maritimibacter sp.]
MTASNAETDFLDALNAARTRDDLFAALGAELRRFGIGGYGYGFTPMRSSRGPMSDLGELHFHHTYPQAWQDAIGDDTRQDNDPSTILLFQGVEQVDWTTLGLAARKLGPDVLQHYEMAQDLGFRCGVSLRLGADHTGRILSGIGLWYPDHAQATVFRADLARDRDRIGRILQLFDIAVRGDHAALMIGLSVRERDALSYLAAGYRSAEASWKMKISEKTLEKHVANAKHKLNARTRDHAVAKALLMGLIAP